MVDESLLCLAYAAYLCLSMMPVGFMLGAECSPCCGCGVLDGKSKTDPKNEGTWTLSGDWPDAINSATGSITASYAANPGNDSGNTWFFFGSPNTSKRGGNATTQEQEDWGNICNWYSHKATSPHVFADGDLDLINRATVLPTTNAVVHIYSPVSTALVGPQTVKTAYFWRSDFSLLITTLLRADSELTATDAAHATTYPIVFVGAQNLGIVNGGALVTTDNGGGNRGENNGTINDGASFVYAENYGTVNDGASFNPGSNFGTVNDGATFAVLGAGGGGGINWDTINGGATFNAGDENLGTVNGGATFDEFATNGTTGVVNGGCTFNGNSQNLGTCN